MPFIDLTKFLVKLNRNLNRFRLHKQCVKSTDCTKTSQECETALTSQYQTIFLVFVFCLSVFLSFGLFVFMSFCLFVVLPFCLFVFMSFCLFVFLYLCLFVFLSFCLNIILVKCLKGLKSQKALFVSKF